MPAAGRIVPSLAETDVVDVRQSQQIQKHT
jgi:hypothetical protein